MERSASRGVPGAALAKVLARMIFACLIATGGKSAKVVRANSRASASANGVSCARAVIKPKVPAAIALLSTLRRVVLNSSGLKAVVLHFATPFGVRQAEKPDCADFGV